MLAQTVTFLYLLAHTIPYKTNPAALYHLEVNTEIQFILFSRNQTQKSHNISAMASPDF